MSLWQLVRFSVSVPALFTSQASTSALKHSSRRHHGTELSTYTPYIVPVVTQDRQATTRRATTKPLCIFKPIKGFLTRGPSASVVCPRLRLIRNQILPISPSADCIKLDPIHISCPISSPPKLPSRELSQSPLPYRHHARVRSFQRL